MEILKKGNGHITRVGICSNCYTEFKYNKSDVYKTHDSTFGVSIELSKVNCPVCGKGVIVRGF